MGSSKKKFVDYHHFSEKLMAARKPLCSACTSLQRTFLRLASVAEEFQTS